MEFLMKDIVFKFLHYVVRRFRILSLFPLDCTACGILKQITQQEIPILWEDVDSFKIFEKICMLVFNQVNKYFLFQFC